MRSTPSPTMRADELFGYDQPLQQIDDVLGIILPLRSDEVFDAERVRAEDSAFFQGRYGHKPRRARLAAATRRATTDDAP